MTDINNSTFPVVIFGVSISKPFQRNEIREMVKARHELMVLASKNGKTLYEASLDLQDQKDAIIKDWSLDDRVAFLNMDTEETNALTNKINDQTHQVLIDNANDAALFQWIIGIVVIIIIVIVFASR